MVSVEATVSPAKGKQDIQSWPTRKGIRSRFEKEFPGTAKVKDTGKKVVWPAADVRHNLSQ